MKLPSKEEIKGYVQFFLLVYSCIIGFWFSFLLAWFSVGLPKEWWAVLVTIVLGFLAGFGLFYWITRGNKDA